MTEIEEALERIDNCGHDFEHSCREAQDLCLLAKAYRGLLARFDELKNTSIQGIYDLKMADLERQKFEAVNELNASEVLIKSLEYKIKELEGELSFIKSLGRPLAYADSLDRTFAELGQKEARIADLEMALKQIGKWSPGCYCQSEEESFESAGKTCPNCVVRETLSGGSHE